MKLMRQATMGDELLEITSWALKRNNKLHLGVSVEQQDERWIGKQELQFWETTQGIQPTDSAEDLYSLLANGLRQRSNQGRLPAEMSEEFCEIEVHSWKKGEAAYVHFANEGLTGEKLSDKAVQLKINCNGRYYLLGTQEVYTWTIVSRQFTRSVPTWTIVKDWEVV
jgi:hypothetical protein